MIKDMYRDFLYSVEQKNALGAGSIVLLAIMFSPLLLLWGVLGAVSWVLGKTAIFFLNRKRAE